MQTLNLQNQLEDFLRDLQQQSGETLAITAIMHSSGDMSYCVSPASSPGKFFATLDGAVKHGQTTLTINGRKLIRAEELEAEAANLRQEAAR
jgi:hypothetical protein